MEDVGVTFNQFKDEFYLIRENRIVIRLELKNLARRTEERFALLGAGAIDYSKEKLQATKDPDKAIIDALATIQADKMRTAERIKELQERNRHIEELIHNAQGVGGEILRLYFIEGLTMGQIANDTNYNKNYCFELMRKTLKALYDKEENKCADWQ